MLLDLTQDILDAGKLAYALLTDVRQDAGFNDAASIVSSLVAGNDNPTTTKNQLEVSEKCKELITLMV